MDAQIIVALDVPSASHIAPLVHQLPQEIRFYKVGLELFIAEGSTSLDDLKKNGRDIFLDLKLHDIPRTVARAVASASRLGVQLLTVHACGGKNMLKDAARSARDAGPGAPKLIAVTALTSLDESDLRDLGVARTPRDHVMKMAELALSCGIDGLVCSPQEVALLRRQFGRSPILVTPGIRLRSDDGASADKSASSLSDRDDQKRTGTPRDAARDGSNYLVVGRPIVEAQDPAAAARLILDDMRSVG